MTLHLLLLQTEFSAQPAEWQHPYSYDTVDYNNVYITGNNEIRKLILDFDLHKSHHMQVSKFLNVWIIMITIHNAVVHVNIYKYFYLRWW